MGMNQQSVTYDVDQFKVYPFSTADVVGGASPTYGTGIVLQGIADVTVTPTIIQTELKGDGGGIIATKGRILGLSVSATYGRLGLDGLAALLGFTVTDTGSGAAEVASLSFSMPNFLPFVKCEVDCKGTDNGPLDFHMIAYKAQLKSATFFDGKTDAFGQPKLDLMCIPLLSTGNIGTLALYASLTPLD